MLDHSEGFPRGRFDSGECGRGLTVPTCLLLFCFEYIKTGRVTSAQALKVSFTYVRARSVELCKYHGSSLSFISSTWRSGNSGFSNETQLQVHCKTLRMKVLVLAYKWPSISKTDKKKGEKSGVPTTDLPLTSKRIIHSQQRAHEHEHGHKRKRKMKRGAYMNASHKKRA